MYVDPCAPVNQFPGSKSTSYVSSSPSSWIILVSRGCQAIFKKLADKILPPPPWSCPNMDIPLFISDWGIHENMRWWRATKLVGNLHYLLLCIKYFVPFTMGVCQEPRVGDPRRDMIKYWCSCSAWVPAFEICKASCISKMPSAWLFSYLPKYKRSIAHHTLWVPWSPSSNRWPSTGSWFHETVERATRAFALFGFSKGSEGFNYVVGLRAPGVSTARIGVDNYLSRSARAVQQAFVRGAKGWRAVK